MGRIKELTIGTPALGEDIKVDYFHWLCELIKADEPDHSYMILARQLHNKEFFSLIVNDNNRAEDGKKLRDIYADESPYRFCDYEVLEGPCSVLEMLIGLASRMEDILHDPEKGDRTINFFWEMIENLELGDCSDDNYNGPYFDPLCIDERVNIFLDRRYKKSGKGGLFPLKYSKKDQRKIEIWYQMSQYLIENYEAEL